MVKMRKRMGQTIPMKTRSYQIKLNTIASWPESPPRPFLRQNSAFYREENYDRFSAFFQETYNLGVFQLDYALLTWSKAPCTPIYTKSSLIRSFILLSENTVQTFSINARRRSWDCRLYVGSWILHLLIKCVTNSSEFLHKLKKI